MYGFAVWNIIEYHISNRCCYIKKELKELKALKRDQEEEYKIAIVIGPEGGFEPVDVEVLSESGAKVVTLGNRILRTETVALNMISVITYELET